MSFLTHPLQNIPKTLFPEGPTDHFLPLSSKRYAQWTRQDRTYDCNFSIVGLKTSLIGRG